MLQSHYPFVHSDTWITWLGKLGQSQHGGTTDSGDELCRNKLRLLVIVMVQTAHSSHKAADLTYFYESLIQHHLHLFTSEWAINTSAWLRCKASIKDENGLNLFQNGKYSQHLGMRFCTKEELIKINSFKKYIFHPISDGLKAKLCVVLVFI